ncbi:hypothetical protein AMAG_02573 [Allomyces macrogynus ATCC 38327]|uniref:Uncharacterized protein n=1 Tax=Allomyces macrogynus (strain ATCC 38327) TaxID=578462 RepID=A0A0L0S2I8_ALLM3|nr:hypothetical protein AMAG_02573 [Allomyces macrogynus ATCC 38327]|eukprot:KNE56797.1 hypothetical protein AMAG_02573 [Allomyces macrogynus ATCC 38327]
MPATICITRNVWALLPARLRAYEHLKLITEDHDTHSGNLLFAPPAADAMDVDDPANPENTWVGAKVASVTEININDVIEVWVGDRTEWRESERKTGYIVVSRVNAENETIQGCWLWRWQEMMMGGEHKVVNLQDLATRAAAGVLFCVSDSGMCVCKKPWELDLIVRRLVPVKHGPQIAHHDHQAQRFLLNPTREIKGCTDRAELPDKLPTELALGKVLVMANGTIMKKGTLLYTYDADENTMYAGMVPMDAGRPRLDAVGAPVIFGRINATAFVPTVLATYGPRAKSGTYEQVGNAFPLPVAYLIRRAIREAMELWEETLEVGRVV